MTTWYQQLEVNKHQPQLKSKLKSLCHTRISRFQLMKTYIYILVNSRITTLRTQNHKTQKLKLNLIQFNKPILKSPSQLAQKSEKCNRNQMRNSPKNPIWSCTSESPPESHALAGKWPLKCVGRTENQKGKEEWGNRSWKVKQLEEPK